MLNRIGGYDRRIVDSYYDDKSNSQVIVVKDGEKRLQFHSDEELIGYVKENIRQMNNPTNAKNIITQNDVYCHRNLGDFPEFFDNTFGDFIQELKAEKGNDR